MIENRLPIRRALLSVSDKTGLVALAKALQATGVEIIATGGTAQCLQAAAIAFQPVESITQFPEMMEGRVKTLHPKIHGGILGLRDKHAAEAQAHDIDWIDLVVINLYPFEETVAQSRPYPEVIEQIDIGGPAMLRAAAKNHAWVTVVHDPRDYASILDAIALGGTDFVLRQSLARAAFAHTSRYDAAIAMYLGEADNRLQPWVTALLTTQQASLRYGENPHQTADVYTAAHADSASSAALGYGVANASLLQGKALSYNNYIDAHAALACVHGFTDPAAVIVKHTNPCGVAAASTIEAAYQCALAADSLSAFGGVIALNRPCTAQIAEQVTSIFVELLIAPQIEEAALPILAKKPNVRVLVIADWARIHIPYQVRCISGGLLMQQTDTHQLTADRLQCVTQAQPSAEQIDELLFAWHVVKHLKSNAIAITKNQASLGLCGGQVSRIAALQQALSRGGDQLSGAVLASDAFFPFRDSIDVLQGTGIRAIIQPGGSIRDAEVIAACDEQGIAMVFTGVRCFSH